MGAPGEGLLPVLKTVREAYDALCTYGPVSHLYLSHGGPNVTEVERAEVPNLLAPYIWRYTATDYDGNCHEIAFRRHEPGHNHYYEKIEGELVEHGIARRVTFGCADAHLVDCVKETDYMVKRLQEEPTLFMHEYN